MSATQRSNGASERRVAVRRQPAVGTVCELAGGDGMPPALGLVWNISASGVSMLLRDRPEPGASLDAELKTTNGAHSLPLRLRVAHVSKLRTGDYIMGGQFPRHLEPDEMKPFLG
jgi:hypothetical protein